MDVIVVGSGPAGLLASVAAARQGAKVLLVERYGYLGGGISSIECNWIGGWSNIPTREQVITGLPEELVQMMIDEGITPGYEQPEGEFCEVAVDAEQFKFIADDFVLNNGVNLLFHSTLCGAVVENDVLKAINVANKAGIQQLSAEVFVDATGDGDLVAYAGAPYELSAREDQQMATMMFKMTHVNTERILAFAEETYGEVGSQSLDTSGVDVQVDAGKWVFGFSEIFEEAKVEARRQGKVADFRTPLIAIGAVTGGEYVEDEYWLLNTDVPVDSTDPEDLTQLEIDCRRQIRAMLPILKKLPGFENARLDIIAPRAGIREGRRPIGEYVLTKEDVIECHQFEDVVCYGTHHVDIHGSGADPGHKVIKMTGERGIYDIPYRALVPKEIDNLLVAGRCISTTPEANYSTRFQAVCMGTGQAAGVAAAMAAKQKLPPRALDVKELQGQLVEIGALVRY